MQWQLSTPSTPLPIRYQSSTTGDTSSRVAEKNQGEYIHFQCSLIIDQCNANWSKSVSSNTQQLNCHLDPNPIPMHCKTNTCRYQSNANQEPLFYHLDMLNQCRWLGYQWTIIQPIQSQPRTTIIPLGQEKPMQMTWLPINNHSTNPKPTKCPLLYHWDITNQCRWLDYQWTTTQPTQCQPRPTILPLGHDTPMQMTWLHCLS